MSARDLYAVLGVPRDASSSAIRRAYKDHVLRVHPDKQPEGALREAAEARFKEICSAYEVLSDPRARAHHDSIMPLPSLSSMSSSNSNSNSNMNGGGNSSFASSSPFESEDFKRQFAADMEKKMRSDGETMDSEELFSAMFGERRANFKIDTRPKPEDKQLPLALTLEDLHMGCVKRRKLQRTVQDRATGDFVQTTSVLRIDVKPGYRPGDRIRFKDAGSESDTQKAPDVVFVIEQKAHLKFQRVGDDLILPLNLSLAESLTGVNQTIVGIDGEEFLFAMEGVAKPGDTHVIEKMGLSKRGKAGARGNLVVKFVVTFPDRLLPGEKKTIKDILAKVDARLMKESNSSDSSTSSSPQKPPTMRRTASMFAARAREFSDVTATNEEREFEPKSTGRRAFKESENNNNNSSSKDTGGSSTAARHSHIPNLTHGKRASTATPMRHNNTRHSRDTRRPSVRMSRDRKHVLRRESNAPMPAGLSALSGISRKNSEVVKEYPSNYNNNSNMCGGTNESSSSTKHGGGNNNNNQRKRNKKSWLGGLFR